MWHVVKVMHMWVGNVCGPFGSHKIINFLVDLSMSYNLMVLLHMASLHIYAIGQVRKNEICNCKFLFFIFKILIWP